DRRFRFARTLLLVVTPFQKSYSTLSGCFPFHHLNNLPRLLHNRRLRHPFHAPLAPSKTVHHRPKQTPRFVAIPHCAVVFMFPSSEGAERIFTSLYNTFTHCEAVGETAFVSSFSRYRNGTNILSTLFLYAFFGFLSAKSV